MSLAAMQWCLARLYVSQTYRLQFNNDPDGALTGYGLTDDEAAAVHALDQHMLDLFATNLISGRQRWVQRAFSSSFAWHHAEMDAAFRRFAELNRSWPHPTFHHETVAFGRFAQHALSDPERFAPGAAELVRFERASYEAMFLCSTDDQPSAQLQLSSHDRVRGSVLIEDFAYDVVALDAALRAGTTNPDTEYQATTIVFRPGRLQPEQRLLRLNSAMSSVLRHCDDGSTVADVVDDVIRDLGNEASRQDIIDILQKLVALQIVTVAPGTFNERTTVTASNTSALSQIPTLGSGLGYRHEIRNAIFAARDQIDVLEIITEQFFSAPAELEEIAEQFAVIPHGTSMSVGTVGELDWDYLRMVKKVSDLAGSPYYSDHLAITRAAGINIGKLTPLWFTEDILTAVIRNVSTIQDFLLKPLVLENISYLFEIPGSTMTQGEFFTRLVDATGCGVLLDVANVHINATNHHFDPVEFINAMPLHAVVQIHLAGGYWQDGVYIDAHSEPVNEPTWDLLDVLAQRVPIRVSILERDADFPNEIDPLLDEVARSRRIIRASAGCAY